MFKLFIILNFFYVSLYQEIMGSTKVDYIENVRILLTFMNVVYHCTAAYRPFGVWFLIEGDRSFISDIIIGPYMAMIPPFSMMTFFMLAGLFVPASFNKRGTVGFLFDRIKRIGVPLVIFSCTMIPIFEWIYLDHCYTPSSRTLWEYYQQAFQFNTYHLWFLEILLLYCVMYAIFAAIAKKKQWNITISQPPTNKKLVLLTIFLGGIAFIIRIWIPLHEQWVTAINALSHFPFYIAGFGLGIWAANTRWFETVSLRTGKVWFFVGILGYGILNGLFIGLSEYQLLFQGFSIWNLLYAFGESITAVGWCVGVPILFRFYYNRLNRMTRFVKDDVYTIYIIHFPIPLLLQCMMHTWVWHPLLKAGLIILVTIPLSIILSHFIVRKIPGLKQLL